MLVKRLAILLKSGMPILPALHLLETQAAGRPGRDLLQDAAEAVERGGYLYEALGRLKVFGKFELSLIKVGELSGNLKSNLAYLADELKKRQELRQKIIGALIYPAIILAATLAISALLVFYIFPKLLPVFSGFEFSLPWTTRLLIWLTGLLLHYGWILAGVMAAVVVLLSWLFRRPACRFWLDRQAFRLPIFGRMFLNYALTNIARTLGSLLQGRAAIVEALLITADTSTSAVLAERLRALSVSLSAGQNLAEGLSARGDLFPAMFVQMVGVGEATGNLSESLLFLAEVYEGEVEEMSKNLSSLLEPVLMIIMGLVVGFIALSIITPIYQLTQNLHP